MVKVFARSRIVVAMAAGICMWAIMFLIGKRRLIAPGRRDQDGACGKHSVWIHGVFLFYPLGCFTKARLHS